MKKLISVMLILALLIGVTACSSDDNESNEKLKDDLFAIYEELRPIYKGNTTNEEVRDYLAGVADRYEIYNKKLPGDSLLLMKQADPHYQDTLPTTLQCSISTGTRHEDAQSASIALAVLKNIENHGQITVIITGEDYGKYYGAQSLPIKYLKTDNFINLRYEPKAQLITGSAATEDYILRSKAETEEISNGKAFEISILSGEGTIKADQMGDYPNPIMELGLLLSDCKNRGINLQIASIGGEFSPGKEPIYAKAVVVIQSDDEQRLLTRIESSIEDFENDYDDIKPGINYTFAPVDLPKSALSHDSTTRLLSLIYTIDEGISGNVEDEDDKKVVANSGIEKISLSDAVNVNVVGRSLSKEEQDTIRSSYESIANLNSYSFSASVRNTLWNGPKENLLADSISIAANQSDLKLKSSTSLEDNECAIFAQKKEDLQAVSFGVNIQQGFEISKSLMLFLESLHQSRL